MIYEARVKKSNLTVVWLDVVNTYGSIPHSLIRTALKHYHIPDHIKGMISCYVGGIKLRFKTKDYIMQWQQLEKGIVLVCTISPFLFVTGINLIITAAEKVTRGPMMGPVNQ